MNEHEANAQNFKFAMIENMVTIMAVVIVISVVAYFVEGLYCLWGLVLLLNINTMSSAKSKGE